ncbi:MAG: biosynthetic peptidoglycan transglycosylase [Gemmatimonadota bacterium]
MYPPRLLIWYSRNLRRLVLGTAAVFSLLFMGSFLYSISCGFHGCPSVAKIRAYLPNHRSMVPLARIPENVRNAFIAVEDHRFSQHHGIDWRAFGRAFVRNATSLGVREGASTLTMQVARSAFIRDDDCSGRSFGRKLVELRLAPRIESALTKDQILALYLNLIYLGDGMYGVEAASRHYFGKSVSRLSLSEAAMLAAMPKAPEVYDPQEHPDRTKERRNLVLRLMTQEGFITASQATQATDQRLRVASQGRAPARPGSSRVVQVVSKTVGGTAAPTCAASSIR